MISYPFFGDQPAMTKRCRELGIAVPLATAPRAAFTANDVRAALARVAGERSTLAARLSEAREWELATIRERPQVIARIRQLMAGATARPNALHPPPLGWSGAVTPPFATIAKHFCAALAGGGDTDKQYPPEVELARASQAGAASLPAMVRGARRARCGCFTVRDHREHFASPQAAAGTEAARYHRRADLSVRALRLSASVLARTVRGARRGERVRSLPTVGDYRERQRPAGRRPDTRARPEQAPQRARRLAWRRRREHVLQARQATIRLPVLSQASARPSMAVSATGSGGPSAPPSAAKLAAAGSRRGRRRSRLRLQGDRRGRRVFVKVVAISSVAGEGACRRCRRPGRSTAAAAAADRLPLRGGDAVVSDAAGGNAAERRRRRGEVEADGIDGAILECERAQAKDCCAGSRHRRRRRRREPGAGGERHRVAEAVQRQRLHQATGCSHHRRKTELPPAFWRSIQAMGAFPTGPRQARRVEGGLAASARATPPVALPLEPKRRIARRVIGDGTCASASPHTPPCRRRWAGVSAGEDHPPRLAGGRRAARRRRCSGTHALRPWPSTGC